MPRGIIRVDDPAITNAHNWRIEYSLLACSISETHPHLPASLIVRFIEILWKQMQIAINVACKLELISGARGHQSDLSYIGVSQDPFVSVVRKLIFLQDDIRFGAGNILPDLVIGFQMLRSGIPNDPYSPNPLGTFSTNSRCITLPRRDTTRGTARPRPVHTSTMCGRR